MNKKDLDQAIADTKRQQKITCCRLVATRGSTPQKAGATMFVYESGHQLGTLGGGCVEAEVKRKAIRQMHSAQGQIETFQLDHDYGWDDGLICGGRMTVLLQPMSSEAATIYFDQLAQQLHIELGFTEAIVFESEPELRRASLFLFNETGQSVAELSPESIDHQQQQPTPSINERAPSLTLPNKLGERLISLSMRPRPYTDRGVGFLPHLPRCPLYIVGAGHVGYAVSKLASEVDFDVTVIDDRPELVTTDRFPAPIRTLTGNLAEVLPGLKITPQSYCLIVTRGHNHDQLALHMLIGRGARYVGMIGSRRKIRLIRDNLLDEGVSPELLGQVFAPVGMNIGSQTVPEIAISITAELIAHRNREGNYVRDRKGKAATQPGLETKN